MKKLMLLFMLTLSGWSAAFSQCLLDANITDLDCVFQTGSIEVSISNAFPPYDLNINGQPITTSNNLYTFSNLFGGIYDIELTDANGCMTSITVVLDTPTPPVITLTADQLICQGTEACIFTNISGGTGGFTYEWNDPNGQQQPSFCTINPGVYTVTVTDANGCSAVASTTIIQEPSPVITITEEIVDCNLSLLTADVNPNQGAEFNWSIGANTQTIEVIAAGTYSVTVVDFNGCFGTADFDYNGGQLFYQANVRNISCDGNSDGSISGTISSGVTPSSIQWTGPNGFSSNQLNIDNLIVGDYLLELSDGMGCDASFTYTITQPTEILVTATSTDVSCNGSCDGQIDLIVSGGTPPYAYLWSDFSTTQNLIGICAGTYSVTVTDSNGCEESFTIDITEPQGIVSGLTFSAQSCLADGTASVAPSGGIGNYTIEWSTMETGSTIENLIAGTYWVRIMDENNCFVEESFEIVSPIGLEVSSTFAGCDLNDGTATATITGGTSSPIFEWSNGETDQTITGLAPGGYSVTVTDASTLCQVHRNVIVEEDPSCFVLISGHVYIDDIVQDCVVDSTTENAYQIRVELSDGQVIYTDVNGYYEFTADAGTYVVTIYPNNAYETLCNDPITVAATTWGDSYTDNDFYLKYGPDSDIRVKVIKPNARPGFTQTVRICLMNVGAQPVSGTLTFTHPDILEFLSSSPAETNYDIDNNLVSWDYTDIPPGAVWIYFPQMKIPVGTPLGTPLTYSFNGGNLSNDITPWDNEITCSMEVTGSYDPNDKAVDPMGIGPEGIISMTDSLLSYKIRFQNTGTDTAFTVLIRDTLDVNLDTRSIVPGPASHDYTMKLVEGNIVELLFENILLPDSFVNEPGSNGFVIFDVRVKNGSPYGTVIENTAGIYFDFNPPIITNTVINTIQMIVDVDNPIVGSINVEVIPNPTAGQSYLNYHLEESEVVTIALYDLQGRFVQVLEEGLSQNAGDQKILLQTDSHPNGVYFINITTNSGKQGMVKMIQLK